MIRKLLFSMSCMFFIQIHGQSFTENFDNISNLTSNGWYMQNISQPQGSTTWFQGDPSTFPAYNGANNAYIAANFNNTAGNGTINNWLLTPVRTFKNGDILTFYTRKVSGQDFPDRLEVRLSIMGASTNVGSGSGVGSFVNLLLSINPALQPGVYPTEWTQYTVIISELQGPVSGRIGFRYFVSNGGPSGSNSDYIGIDNVVYTENDCPPIHVNVEVENISCHGENDGSVIVEPSGGTGFTYTWSHDSNNTSNTATGLSPGTYSCTISSECGDMILKTFIITEPPLMELSLDKVISCDNPTQNTFTANATGGFGAFTYLWSNGATTPSVSNLPVGNHFVTVTDYTGCSLTEQFMVQEEPLQILHEDSIAICYNQPITLSPQITPELSDGEEYTYVWTHSNGNFLSNHPDYHVTEFGAYTLTVTSPSGCIISKTIEVVPQIQAPEVAGVYSFTEGQTLSDIPVAGENLTWRMGSDVIPDTTTIQDMTFYWVTQTIGGCESIPTRVITMQEAVTWTGNEWINGMPSQSAIVRIMGDLNIGTDTPDFSAMILYIGPEGSLTISENHSLTIQGIYINESNLGAAGFVLESGGNLMHFTSANDNVGEMTIKRKSQPMKRLDYTLWSSPVTQQNLFAFSPETINGVTNYPGSTGRIYEYDGATNTYVNPDPFNESAMMNSGKGYLFRAPNNYHATNQQVYEGIFTGIPTNRYIEIPTFPSGYTSVGNPYTSNINADAFFIYNSNVSTLYFWNNTGVSGSNYATYTRIGGTAAGNGYETPNGIISVGQGFIVQTTANYVSFNVSMMTLNDEIFFKENENGKHRFWLGLTNETNEKFNQILVGYMDGATNGIDHQIDGKQFAEEVSSLYSVINEENYTIQGRALPFENSDVVKLGFKAVEAGKFNISLNNFDGLFAEGNTVIYLKDKLLNAFHNLMESNYTFESEADEFNERFEIVYGTDGTMGIDDLNANNIQIYTQNQNIFVSSKNEKILSVELFDLSGRNIHSNQNVNANIYQIKSNSKGVLVIKVQTQNGETLTKKIINR